MTTVNESQIKLLKKMFQAIAEMKGLAGSGLGKNDDVKCIIIDNWVRVSF